MESNKHIKKLINGKFQKAVYSKNGISPTVMEDHGDVVRILVTPKLTNSQEQSTEKTTEMTIKATAMQQELFPSNSQTSIYLLRDSLARAFQLLVGEKECRARILEVLYSLKFGELQGINDLEHYCLKMCQDCSHLREARIFTPFFNRWMKSGMMSNGIVLTLRISEYHKAENVYSLSDILEEQVDKKYFLSERMIKGIMSTEFQERKPQNPNKICRTLKIGGDVPCILE